MMRACICGRRKGGGGEVGGGGFLFFFLFVVPITMFDRIQYDTNK